MYGNTRRIDMLKRGRKRISKDGHKLTGVEIKRRHDDNASSIDIELDKAFELINWDRRNKASKSLVAFINTYFVGLMVDTPPSEKFVEALGEMEFALS